MINITRKLKLLRVSAVLLLGVFFCATFGTAFAAVNVNDGIYFSDAYKDRANYFPRGYTEHVFNKYLDSLEKCRAFMKLKNNEIYFIRQQLQHTDMSPEELERLSSLDECVGPLYTDEREFVGINKLYGSKTNSINPIMQEVYYKYGLRQMYYDLIFSLQANIGDIFQTKIYVHDNVGTNPSNVLKDTKVNVTIEGNTITAKVGNNVIYSVDTSSINISADQELFFAQSSDYPANIKLGSHPLSDMSNYVIEAESITDPKTLKTTIKSRNYRDLRSSEYTLSADRKSFTYTKGDQIGSFPYSYSLVLDLVVKKKTTTTQTYTCVDRINGVPGAGPRLPLPADACTPGQTRVINGQTVTCTASCQFPDVPVVPPTGDICRSLYYSDQAEFRRRGYECITVDGRPTSTCTGDQPYNGYGACKLLPQNPNSKCTACGCIEIYATKDSPVSGNGANMSLLRVTEADGREANQSFFRQTPAIGNYQTVWYTLEVSNQTDDTVASEVHVLASPNVRSLTDGSRKLRYVGNNRGGNAEFTSEGDIQFVNARVVLNSKSPYRNSTLASASIPAPEVDANSLEAFKNNPVSQPIIVKNLYPGTKAGTIDTKSNGDYIQILIEARVRTDASGQDKLGDPYTPFQTAQFVDDLFMVKTVSPAPERKTINNAADTVIMSRPYFQTYNAGDVVTSALITGIINASTLAKSVGTFQSGVSYNEVSGFLFDSGATQQVFDSSKNFQGISYSTGFKKELTDNINKTTSEGMSKQGSLFGGSNVTLNSESNISNTAFSQRLDGERIFTLDSGNVTISGNGVINGSSQRTLSLGNRSTIIIKNGDLIINSNITYAENTNSIVPAVAFILQNGSIKIDPRVSRIDGVYVADKFMGTDGTDGTVDWKSGYERGQFSPIKLLVNGSLLGSINELITSRPFVDNPNASEGGASIDVNYDGRMIATPPPGLRDILGGSFEKLKQ
ncbi:MAG: hypothetical protein ACK4NC_02860 [Candidatus Gracilibacteria bacterium]